MPKRIISKIHPFAYQESGLQEKIKPVNGVPKHDYLLILSPTEALHEKIMEVKKDFSERFRVDHGSGKPHITLARFSQWETMEQKILHRLQHIAAIQAPFIVEADGFGSFPSHTVFINVSTRTAIQDLVRRIRPLQAFMRSEETDPHFIMEPHITVARKLLPWQYEQGWAAYQHRHFKGRYRADQMLLIRKEEGKKYYELVETFLFANQPDGPKQGVLF